MRSLPHISPPLRTALAFLASAWLSVCALELPFNPTAFVVVFSPGLALELVLVLLAELALFSLAQRRAAFAAPVPLLCLGVGLAQHYVFQFKGTAIMPGDLGVLGTALSVAGNYDYTPDAWCLLGLACCLLAIAPLAVLGRVDRPGPVAPKLVFPNLALSLACALCACYLLWGVSYLNDFHFGVDYWNPMKSYRAQGFGATFMTLVEDGRISPPDGYREDDALALEAELAATYDREVAPLFQGARDQALAQPPSILVVMNETFDDLSRYDGLRDGYLGPAFFNGLRERAALSGDLAVSAYGGGTCNTEFELLTGASLAFVGWGKYPYSAYALGEVENLADLLKDRGYGCFAIHPNLANNWNRAHVYQAFGFDRFLSLEDFPDAPAFHSGVEDKATYQAALDLIAEDGPQFVFDVTMQNHSGYDRGDVPQEYRQRVRPQGVNDSEVNDDLNEYLGCIAKSDDDLAWLVAELEALDEHVVLLFFGDHQPWFTERYNDWFFEGETEVEHGERKFATRYVVWANYDLGAGAQIEEVTSANYLSSEVMQAAGLELSGWQKAKLVLRQSVPAINLMGYLGANGTWYAHDASGPYAVVHASLHELDYLHFGSLQ